MFPLASGINNRASGNIILRVHKNSIERNRKEQTASIEMASRGESMRNRLLASNKNRASAGATGSYVGEAEKSQTKVVSEAVPVPMEVKGVRIERLEESLSPSVGVETGALVGQTPLREVSPPTF